MALQLLDYSPLYRSLNARASSDRASLIPDGYKIGQQMADLQRDQSTRQTISGIVDSGLAIAKGVYGIMEQGAMEKAKALTYTMRQQLEDGYKQAVFNNDFIPIKDDAGNVTGFQEPKSATVLMDGFRSTISEQFKGFDQVAGWATAQIEGANSQAHEWALGQKYAAATQERNDIFKSNLGDSIKAAIAEQKPSIYLKQIDDAPYLSPDQKTLMKARGDAEYIYGTAREFILGTVEDSGISSASKVIEDTKANYSTAQYIQLKKDAATRDSELTKQTTDEFLKTYKDKTAAGDSVENVRSTLLEANIPADRKAAAMEEVEKLQSTTASLQAIHLFDQDRDDLKQLAKDYKRIKEGDLTDSFSGIDKTHKIMLDMFEERLGILTPKPPSKDEIRIESDRRIAYTLMDFQNGNIGLTDAKRLMEEYGTTASPDKAKNTISDMKQMVPLAYQPAFDRLNVVATTSYLAQKGKKKEEELDAKGQMELDNLRGYFMGVSLDMVQESKRDGMTPAIFQERIANLVDTYLGKEYAILREGIVEKGAWFGFIGGQTVDEGAAKFQAMLDRNSGTTADMVYQDSEGRTYWAPGAKDKVQALAEYQQPKAEAAIGKKLTLNYERDGNDVSAQPIYSDPKDGWDYKFKAAPDGKSSILMFRKPKGAWENYTLPGKQAAKPNPTGKITIDPQLSFGPVF